MSSPETPAPERREVTVRRAPKYVPFLVLGGLLGFALAAFLAYGAPGNESYDPGTVFGFFLVPCAAGGAILGAVVALLLDRLSLRRAQHAVVEAVPDSVPDAGPENDGRLDGGTGSQPRP
ncbi:hypothetical protein [Pseudarthrobacter sp. MM222]|uniref:hypothetical protein n=1 Tax=Pseudarthrobacter sp. MM222 TaxID=3018929 RepID=UPI00221F6392|nr:hypothetical protein [Pseudarthrobacter sp. MM222]CAI3804513.1 hypothetical protein NKCBBBOE_03618 [Pseudarthrobacter sp. MM222]